MRAVSAVWFAIRPGALWCRSSGVLLLCGSAGELERSWEATGPGVAVTKENDVGVDRVEAGERGERGECDLASTSGRGKIRVLTLIRVIALN
jgi:hypothetical protein